MAQVQPITSTKDFNPVQIADELGRRFAAADVRDEDLFVADNIKALKEAGLVEAGVPRELGGGGASHAELAEMLRVLGRYCGSTALAFSMHTHQVAIPAWRWTHQKFAGAEPLLKRIATERIILLSSGGSDWITGSGKAEKVEGGYRINARKVFTSGAPLGNLLMTSAVWDSEEGPMVIHFGLPMNSPHVKVMDNWRTLGMRGTGSHDVLIEGHVVPDAAVSVTRKAGQWHPVFQIIATLAFSAGLFSLSGDRRECARHRRRAREEAPCRPQRAVAGRADGDVAARGATGPQRHARDCSAESVNEVMIGRHLVERSAIRTVELAMEAAGGAGFYRAQGLERRFRDIQAARYHPLQSGPQAEYAGAMALGLPTDKIF